MDCPVMPQAADVRRSDGDTAHLLAEWRHTTEVYANPELDAILSRPNHGDHGSVPAGSGCVPKTVDGRVTMVEHQPCAAPIEAASQAGHIDWRADYSSLAYSPCEVPAEVTAGMIPYLDAFGLHFAAFDFGIDHDQHRWFYEANPNGEWL